MTTSVLGRCSSCMDPHKSIPSRRPRTSTTGATRVGGEGQLTADRTFHLHQGRFHHVVTDDRYQGLQHPTPTPETMIHLFGNSPCAREGTRMVFPKASFGIS